MNQRCFDGSRPAEPRELRCEGSCGLTWISPAPVQMLRTGGRCLECDGPLQLA